MAEKPKGAQFKSHRLKAPALREATSQRASAAVAILARAHETANSLLAAYDLARLQRGQAGGISSDAEQDLLRAMLVMSAAGLDAVAKQLVRDALPTLVRQNQSVRAELETFIARSVRSDDADLEPTSGAKFLGRVLASSSAQDAVIAEYTKHLTGGSLQSAHEVAKVAKALGATTVKLDLTQLQSIFGIRNKIIHELDINLGATGRKRVHRGLEDTMKQAQYLLNIAEGIADSVDRACGSA